MVDLDKYPKTDSSVFADDRKLFCNPLTELDRFLADIEAIETWTQDWLMKLNTDKCTILHIGKNNPHIVYNINKTDILTVNEQKDLGVIITENLKWETHIAQMVKKTNSLIYLTNRAFSNKSVEFIKKIYVTFIRPEIEYCYTI